MKLAIMIGSGLIITILNLLIYNEVFSKNIYLVMCGMFCAGIYLSRLKNLLDK